MALPPKLPRGKTSHTLQARMPRYLWNHFIDAAKRAGHQSASAALREAMQDFIIKTRMDEKRRLIIGKPKRKNK